MDEDKPKPPPLEAVVPKSLPGFDVVRAVEPPGLKAQDTPQVRHGAALSKWVLSIISGSIILLITYLVWGEYAIGRDIHELYDHALTTNSTSGESQSLGQLEQLIGDLATARRDGNAPFSADSLRNAQAALQLVDKVPGVTTAEKEHLKACVPPPPANESRNEKLDQCSEDLQRIRNLAIKEASGASSAALIAQATAELHEQRQSLHSFWLQAAQLILLNLLLPLLTALFGYIFGTQQGQSHKE
ncbi:MAG: hypothetical protein ABSE55_07870 [Terracidiphilus sp.]|jgi:hypothetical protein